MQRKLAAGVLACVVAIGGAAPAFATDKSSKKTRAAEALPYDPAVAAELDAAKAQFEYREGDFDFPDCGATAVVFFDRKSAELGAPAREALTSSLSALPRNCVGLKITVEGETDTLGRPEDNMALAAARADAVRAEFVALGFAADSIEVVARGETAQALATADGVSEPLNRRATVAVAGKARAEGLRAAIAVPAPPALAAPDGTILGAPGAEIPLDILPQEQMPNFGRGNRQATYDVILQPGHYLRFKGDTGSEGLRVSERELAAQIVKIMSKDLASDGLKVLVIPANRDRYTQGLKSRVFLSVHFDGSVTPCSTGSSLGYGAGGNVYGLHSIGFALATSLGIGYDSFRADNYTTNLSKYYAFKDIEASLYEGIVEIGEISCPAEEAKFISRGRLIAGNLTEAIRFALKLSPGA